MSKRLKMICAIASFAVCIAILVFGVYSASEVEYSLSGTINYEINTLFVDVNTSLYALKSNDEKSVNSVPSSMPKLESSLVSGSALPTNIVKLDYSNSDTTIQNGISEEETLAYSDALNLNYGDYTGSNNQAYLFYLVMEIKNYSSETVSAILDLYNLYNQTTNTVVQPLYTKINIQGKGDAEYSTAYLITAFGYDYPSFIQSSNFSDITLTVNAGELVPTDVSNFTFSQSGSNYRITAYNGTDTDIVIPSQYNGANVTAIDNNVFLNSNITSVYIPNTITSVGSNCFQNSLYLTTVNIQPSSSSNLTFSSYVFDGCSSLRSIYIPYNVTTLGSYVFYNCTGLSYVIFAKDSKITNIPYYAFYGCSRLKLIVIPNEVTSIGDRWSDVFYNCTNIEEVHIDSVYHWLSLGLSNNNSNPLYVSENARLYVNGELLTEVTASDFGSGDDRITEIPNYAFRNQSQLVSVTIPDFVTSIGSYVFFNCSSLQSITIPSGVTSIGSYAFRDCSSLQSITIPSRVTSIESDAFYNCSSLQSIKIPSGVTNIGNSAFYNCSSLQSINIPSGVKSIGGSAFSSCTNIEEVHIDSVYNWLSLDLSNNYNNPLYVSDKARLYVNGKLLTEVTAPDCESEGIQITEIPSYVFYRQSQLVSVEIGDGVTSIGSYAFRDCSSLQSITIPSGVASIGSYAFSGCTNIEKVHIDSVYHWLSLGLSNNNSNPLYVSDKARLYINGEFLTVVTASDFIDGDNQITEIPDYAFYRQSQLVSVEIGDGVTSIGSYAFRDCSRLQSIEIPSSVTSIGSYAFNDCTNIEEVHIDSVYMWLTLCATFDSNQYSYYQNPLFVSSKAKLYVNGELLTEITASDFESEGIQITEIPSYAFRNQSQLVSVTIPSFVTNIENYAFEDCSSLQSITIPSSVTSIESSTFIRCTNIEEVHIDSVYHWLSLGLSNINSNPLYVSENARLYINGELLIEITTLDFVDENNSNPITEIQSSAFRNQLQLVSVTIPSFVTSIGSYAFRDCSGLQSITIPSGVTSIESNAFRDCSGLQSITIPSGVTSIESNAFYNCISLNLVFNLSSLNIVAGNSDYGYVAYYAETVLNSAPIEENFITQNGNYYYRVDENTLVYLGVVPTNENTYVVIPEGTTTITADMLPNKSLVSITIPSSVTRINIDVFEGCTNIQEVHIDSVYHWLSLGLSNSSNNPLYVSSKAKLYVNGELLTEITASDFGSGDNRITKIPSYAFYRHSLLVSVTIPSFVTSIGSYAFLGCSSLQLITIPSGVTNIEERTFYGCTNLKSVTFGENSVLESIGSYAFYGCSSLQSITIPSDVTSIGIYAFRGCSSLQSITIPSSVTGIGIYAFYSCINLESVTFGENSVLESIGSYAFSDCSSLQSIEIPSGVTSIESFAFYGCTNLKSVTFGENSVLESIGSNAFYNCSSLQSITIPSSVTSIGSSSFGICTNIEEVHIDSVYSYLSLDLSDRFNNPLYVSDKARLYVNGEPLTEITASDFESEGIQITEIPSYAFTYQSQLVSVEIPEFVTSIGSAFSGCTNIEEVQISSVYDWLKISLGSASASPLYSSTKARLYVNGELLTEVTASDFESEGIKITEIPNYAFYGQSQLVSITIPSGVTSIGSSAFQGCTNIQEVHVDSVYDWLNLGLGASSNNPLYVSSKAKLYVNGELLTEVTASDFIDGDNQITEIPNYAFYGQSQLLSVTIPSFVTSIGSDAFYGCSSLQSINIPSGVTSIGSSAFSNCTNLKSVTFGDNSVLESIGSFAFRYCTNLKSVTFGDNSVLESIGGNVFDGCSSLQSINIPSGVTTIGSWAFSSCTSIYRIVVESATVLAGLTGTSTSTMGGLLSAINNAGDRLYVLDSIDGSVPDYVKNNYTKLALTETVDGKTYYIYKKN